MTKLSISHWGLFRKLGVLDQYFMFQILASKLDLRRRQFSIVDTLLQDLAEEAHHLYLIVFSILIIDVSRAFLREGKERTFCLFKLLTQKSRVA